MGTRGRYDPGTFCWVDLATTDSAGAKAFYGEMFGWESEDVPAGEAGTYTMLRLDGGEVAGLYKMEAERREQGIPSHWTSYVSVGDADETAARARELGGTVYGEAFEVMDSGRMAVIGDPTGAVFAAWQPRAHFGAGLVNVPGALTLNQINTHDPDRAAGFYRSLFGWEITQVSYEPPYWGINNNGWLNGGMMGMPEGEWGAPSHWLVYFVAQDLDAAAGRIDELGGTVIVPPMSVGEGRILVALDPQGATFALFEGETDD